MNVLLTNDDGVFAPGLRALGDAFSAEGHGVLVCAPDRERSAASHSVTIGKLIGVEPVDFPGAKRAWAADGTPADCASLGLFLAREAGERVDLVVSGINRGMNQGGACIYSGTVGAAMEAAMCGCQGLAVSLCLDPGDARPDYGPAARVALRVARWALAHPLPLGVMYNLNVPPLPYERIRGVAAARLSPVFLDPPSYVPAGERAWQYHGAPRTYDDPAYDTVKTATGYCSLTRLTWDFRLDADDGEIELR